MNSKPTWLLVAVAAALFAFCFFVERHDRAEKNRPEDHHIVPDLDPAKITALEIQSASQIIRVERSNHVWRLVRPVVYPANSAVVESVLKGLAQWEWQSSIEPDELKNRPNYLEDFGLVSPRVSLSLFVEGDDRPRRLNVGGNSPADEKVYLNMAGSQHVYIAAADFLKTVPLDKDLWRDRTVLDLAGTPFQSMQVRSAGLTFEVKLDPATHLWGMTSPMDARADTGKIQELLAQLAALQVSRFVPEEAQAELAASGLQGAAQSPQLELTFLQGTNSVLYLAVGSSPTNNPSLAYARRQNPANVIEIPRETIAPWEGNYTNFLDRHLISLSPSFIESIHVKGDDEFTVRSNSAGEWEVSGPETTFPADQLLVNQWLSAFTNIAVDIEKKVEVDLAPYGLDKPFLNYNLQFSRDAGMTGQQLLFGTNSAGKIFERLADERSVNAIAPEQFERLPRVSWELRNRDIWHFETNDIVSFEIHQHGADRKFFRDRDKQWVVIPESGGIVNQFGVDEALYRMGNLRAVYWSANGNPPPDQFGFAQADYRISIVVKNGSGMATNTIQFGAVSPHSYPYAAIVRDGQTMVFEFPVDLYDNLVTQYLNIPGADRNRR